MSTASERATRRAFAFSADTFARLRARRIAAALADATVHIVRAF
jgi:hypothetical protein